MRVITSIAALAAACTALAAPPKRLTHDGRLKQDPRFVDGGKAIVYAAAKDPIIMQLLRLDLESGRSVPLDPKAATSQFEPALSPDGR